MRMKKKISFLIFGVILFALISNVIGYQEYLYRWKDNGVDSTGCHGSNEASENGTLVLTLNFTGTLEPLEEFNITIEVLNFTEAIADPYVRRFTLGIPGNMADNAEFSSPLDHQRLNRGEKVGDPYGNYSVTDGDNEFILFAPENPGTYTLGAVAIAGMNQTDERQFAQVYVEGTIEITVVSSEAPATIPGFQLLLVIIPLSVVMLGILLKRKVKTSEK